MVGISPILPDDDAPSFLGVPPIELAKFQQGSRQWFFRLINQEECHGLLELVWNNVNHCLESYRGTADVSNFAELILLEESEVETIGERIRRDVLNQLGSAQQRQHFYYQHAPLFKTLGCWLSGVTSIPYAWRRDAGLLLQTHAKIVGSGHPTLSQSYQFDQIARQAGLNLGEVFATSFSQHPLIQDAAFELPVFLLGLAWFPATRFPETLGVNLALCSYLDQLNGLYEVAGNPLFGQASGGSYRPLALAAIDHYLAEVDPKSHAQIATGHACAMGFIHKNESRLASELMDDVRFSNAADMVALIEKLGPHGCGYHKRGTLADQPIDHWLNPQMFNAHATIQALANSRYVKAGQPGKSALMNLISNPKGRMFGVFSTRDIHVVDTWIATLNTEKKGTDARLPPTRLHIEYPAGPCDTAFAEARQKALAKYSRYPLQKLYPLFLHIDKALDALPMARHFAERWLARHRDTVQKEGLPFSPYSHHQLDLWLAAQHKRQVESYRPLTDAPEETREEIIADAIKLAPLTLIDGAWLRNIVTPTSATSPIGALLYRTLLDELGQGDPTIHHGNIYQDLLASMGVELGDFTAQSFASSPHFDSECLQVPVFWLAISLFPKSFQPETLGLNLAMELSGVGGEYRRAADVLRHYGFSSMFTDLHNTIDNVVSGHTAWAIEAIKQHLDDVAQSGGHKELSHHWRRIWVGYRALSPPTESLLSTLRAFAQRSFTKITQRQDAL